MHKEQIEAITRKFGVDAPSLIHKLNSLGVSDDIKVINLGISIPKAVVSNISALQSELSTQSKVGRLFEITAEGDRLIINTIKSSTYRLSRKQAPRWWKIREEDVQLPVILRGSKVLDVGAGTGLIAEKIRDQFKCDVYALEPSFECSTDYEKCVKRLGKDHVEKLTLEQALLSNPEKYFQAFDVVTVFKYNIPPKCKDEFISSLAKIVKPNGIVFITSVEPDRFYFNEYSESGPYLTEVIQNYFGKIQITECKSSKGTYGLMTCTEPKLSPNYKPF